MIGPAACWRCILMSSFSLRRLSMLARRRRRRRGGSRTAGACRGLTAGLVLRRLLVGTKHGRRRTWLSGDSCQDFGASPHFFDAAASYITATDSRAGLIVNAGRCFIRANITWTVGHSDRRSAAWRVDELLLNCDSCFHIFKGLTLDYVFFFSFYVFSRAGRSCNLLRLFCCIRYVSWHFEISRISSLFVQQQQL